MATMFWHFDLDGRVAYRATPSGALEYVIGLTVGEWRRIRLRYRTDRIGD